MPKLSATTKSNPRLEKCRHQRFWGANVDLVFSDGNCPGRCSTVGRCLRELRLRRELSLRALADQSGLNVNTLSLIENGKTSPSVSTLQQLAGALQVPITAFFETELKKTGISYQKAGQHPLATFDFGTVEDLGAGLIPQSGQPFLLTVGPKTSSGPIPIVHTGREFVFCLEGQLSYGIEDQVYHLNPGDSLLFEAYLPHCWQNSGETATRLLLVLCPADGSDRPTDRHFKWE